MIFFPFFKKFGFFGILGPPCCGIGATFRIGQERYFFSRMRDFLLLVLLSAHTKIFSVSRMQDFFVLKYRYFLICQVALLASLAAGKYLSLWPD